MLNKLKWKFARFMQGRYGIDYLYLAGGILLFALQLLQIFLHNSLISFASMALLVWILYRVFSKNIYARQAENKRFLDFTGKVKSKWSLFSRRVREIKTHRYRKCSACQTTLRLPRKRGEHKVRCPRCQNIVEVKILI